MHWYESTCPICGVNTSGQLPLNVMFMSDGEYNPNWGKVFQCMYFPCKEHNEFFMRLLKYEQDKLDRSNRHGWREHCKPKTWRVSRIC